MSAGRDRGTMLPILALIVAAALVGTPGESHEKHRKPAGAADSAAIEADGADHEEHEGAPHGAPPGGEESPFEMPPVEELVVHHLHNKLIHLPIVLTPVALILLLAERRRAGAGVTAPLFVWGAALSSVAAYFSGRAQAGAFDGGPKQWLVGTHQTWGTAAMIMLVVWAVATSWPKTRRHAWIVGAIAAVTVVITAMYGGLVAHG